MTTGSRLGGVALGLGVAAMGVLFTWLLWRGFDKALETARWEETPCHVLVSEVESFRPTDHSPVAHRFRVEYTYTFGGEPRVSTRYRRIDGPTNHHARAEALVARFPAGTDAVCFVNPANPAEAVLKRDSKGPGFSLWFPLLFVVGGLGIAVGSLRRGRGQHP